MTDKTQIPASPLEHTCCARAEIALATQVNSLSAYLAKECQARWGINPPEFLLVRWLHEQTWGDSSGSSHPIFRRPQDVTSIRKELFKNVLGHTLSASLTAYLRHIQWGCHDEAELFIDVCYPAVAAGTTAAIYAFIQDRVEDFQSDLEAHYMPGLDELCTTITQGASTRRYERCGLTCKCAIEIKVVEGGLVRISCEGATCVITTEVRRKLYERYMKHAKTSNGIDQMQWPARLFCMLCRYKTMRNVGARTTHAAADYFYQGPLPQFLKALEMDTPSIEVYGTPLSARSDLFCSAFPDVDRYFGCIGRPDELRRGWSLQQKLTGADGLVATSELPLSGRFIVHPPRIEAVMDQMADLLEAELARSEAAGAALTFMIIVPNWSSPPQKCQSVMDASAYKRMKPYEFWEGAYGMLSGKSHTQARPEIVASKVPTLVYVLQTSTAKCVLMSALGVACKTAFVKV